MSTSQQKVYVVVHLYMKVIEIVNVFLSEDAAKKLCETLSSIYNDYGYPVKLPDCGFIVLESILIDEND